MGLDITAYSGLQKIDTALNEDGEPVDRAIRESGCWVKLIPCSDFFERSDGIGGIYSYEKYVDFRAGSYIGYNHWREQLAKLAGYPLTPYERMGVTWREHAAGAWAAAGGPFWELIRFSDCEGVIGPVTSAKLARDFAEHQAKAETDARFLVGYHRWRNAFELAADRGAVKFH